MPYLIDGNNLSFALDEMGLAVGREGLCKLLTLLLPEDPKVHVVFDGPPPPAGHAQQIDLIGIQVTYAHPHSADDLILESIAADSAPRRLNVISSDREIRTAARRRRCPSTSSQDFARKLLALHRAARQPEPTPDTEPTEKQTGLTDEQTRQWLDEFGLDD